MKFRQIAPNMVTSGNLLCGLFSLMLTMSGRYVPAAWLIFFAVIFDGLDGKVARMLGGGSQFGLEFDSLADLVSFGVAPALLLYHAFLKGWTGVLGPVVACFFALCVALRLARFNVVHIPGPFQGLPCPAGGLFIASFILEPLGFVVTAALLMFAYGLLLGEKKWWRLIIIACVLGVFLHIAFSGLLGVSLPRGTVPFLRNFSLFLENLF